MALKKVKDERFKKAVEQVENENKTPLVDESTPVVSDDGFIHGEPMLYGYKDPETGEMHNTFTYREMDGRDEEAIQKGDVKSNGSKVTNLIVERCVSEIGGITKKDLGVKKWGEFIRNLLQGDLIYMMVKVRKVSKGNIISFTHKCPNCQTKLVTEMGIDELPVTPFPGYTEIPFSLPGRGYRDNHNVYHKEGVLHLMRGVDSEVVTPLLMKNKAAATTMMLARTIQFDDGTPIFLENIKGMSLKDRDYLSNLHVENTFGVDVSLDEVYCTSCGHDLSGERFTSDFF